MPKWGLTAKQRELRPWGIEPELLKPAKTITDPIHGEIYLTNLEVRVLDSGAMQRLRRVNQVGSTHLVYPGATHSRLSHSLGALRVAQDLLDVVVDHENSPHPESDLFGEWKREDSSGIVYERSIAEATVLARLGALLHDMCHVPFGHSVEDDLGLLDPHDENLERFARLWQQITNDPQVASALSAGLGDAVWPLIMSKASAAPGAPEHRYLFVQDLVGNTICADLLDYLRRDHLYTGLPMALGTRFLSGFYVTPSSHALYPRRMVVSIAKDGRERSDVVSELFKHLRYRYELGERALYHHAKLAADVMIGNLLELLFERTWVEAARSEGLPVPSPADVTPGSLPGARQVVAVAAAADFESLTSAARTDLEDRLRRAKAPAVAIDQADTPASVLAAVGEALAADAELRSTLSAATGNGTLLRTSAARVHVLATQIVSRLHAAASAAADDTRWGPPIATAIAVYTEASEACTAPLQRAQLAVQRAMEDLFLRHGDFGLLEFLATRQAADGDLANAGSELAERLLNRRLYKTAGYSSQSRALAERVWTAYGSAEQRSSLVADAAAAVSASSGRTIPAWHVALWIPKPGMRLKPAGVLVDDGSQVAELKERDLAGENRGEEIYNSHRALWAVQLFLHPDLNAAQAESLRQFFADRLGIKWGQRPATTVVETGDSATLEAWLEGFVEALATERDFNEDQTSALLVGATGLSARGAADGRDGLKATIRAAADSIAHERDGDGPVALPLD